MTITSYDYGFYPPTYKLLVNRPPSFWRWLLDDLGRTRPLSTESPLSSTRLSPSREVSQPALLLELYMVVFPGPSRGLSHILSRFEYYTKPRSCNLR